MSEIPRLVSIVVPQGGRRQEEAGRRRAGHSAFVIQTLYVPVRGFEVPTQS